MSKQKTGSGALFAGGLAAILASSCCLGPLLLVMLGFSGAWIGKLRLFEAFNPTLIGLAIVAMIFAYRQIYRDELECTPGQVCAMPKVNLIYKIVFWKVAALILLAIGFPFIAPYFY